MCMKMPKPLSAKYYQENKRKTTNKSSRKISKSF